MGEGDLAAQTEWAYLNVASALRAAGATTDNLIRDPLCTVDLSPDNFEQVVARSQTAAEKLGVEFQHPGTYTAVTSLFDPTYLNEFEAQAVIEP